MPHLLIRQKIYSLHKKEQKRAPMYDRDPNEEADFPYFPSFYLLQLQASRNFSLFLLNSAHQDQIKRLISHAPLTKVFQHHPTSSLEGFCAHMNKPDY